LGEYLDESLDPEVRAKLHQHVTECPNCWVILDTTEKTIKVYKGLDPENIPDDIHHRLMSAVEKKISAAPKEVNTSTLH
jgi:hypothetical protein